MLKLITIIAAAILRLPGVHELRVLEFAANDLDCWPQSSLSFCTPVPMDERAAVATHVASALAELPESVRFKYIESVGLYQRIAWNEAEYGATYCDRKIYLTCGSIPTHYPERLRTFLRESLYHELSSILLNSSERDVVLSIWACYSDPSAYTNNALALAQTSAIITQTEELWSAGFVNGYGTANLENDFNTYCYTLFCGDNDLWTMAERYPVVRQKMHLAIEVCQRADPSLNYDWFSRRRVAR